MTQAFTQFIEDLIEENILESSDEELIENLGKAGHPTTSAISHARSMINKAIAQSRKNRLQSKKQEFLTWKDSRIESVKQKAKSVDEMVSEIVAAMASKPDNVPEGLLIAFRNQNENTSDEDIQSLWNDLVNLGLIDSKDSQE